METDVLRYVRRALIKSRRMGIRTKTKRTLIVTTLCVFIVSVGIFTRDRRDYRDKPSFNSGYYVNQRTNEESPGIKRGKNRLYVGVMTTGKFLNTRANAVFHTWGSNPFVSKIDFFARRTPRDTKKYNFSIVTLPDVDDLAYPPQKKSFRMLQYICETQLHKYDWFLRADDDVYIKVQEFIGYVVLPSNSKIGYLGHPGHGRDLDSDAHRLLGTDTYCMGGPGILFSNWALRKMCPHLESCRKNVLIKNEDIEVGRCVKKHVGPGCKTPKEMMYRFFHVSNDKLPPLLKGNYSSFKPFKRALTLHPLKNPADMYRLHEYYMSFRKELRTTMIKKNNGKKAPTGKVSQKAKVKSKTQTANQKSKTARTVSRGKVEKQSSQRPVKHSNKNAIPVNSKTKSYKGKQVKKTVDKNKKKQKN